MCAFFRNGKILVYQSRVGLLRKVYGREINGYNRRMDKSRDTSVRIATGYGLDDRWAQPPSQWSPEALSQEVKQTGCQTDPRVFMTYYLINTAQSSFYYFYLTGGWTKLKVGASKFCTFHFILSGYLLRNRRWTGPEEVSNAGKM
jgi:hypothetical protein